MTYEREKNTHKLNRVILYSEKETGHKKKRQGINVLGQFNKNLTLVTVYCWGIRFSSEHIWTRKLTKQFLLSPNVLLCNWRWKADVCTFAGNRIETLNSSLSRARTTVWQQIGLFHCKNIYIYAYTEFPYSKYKIGAKCSLRQHNFIYIKSLSRS